MSSTITTASAGPIGAGAPAGLARFAALLEAVKAGTWAPQHSCLTPAEFAQKRAARREMLAAQAAAECDGTRRCECDECRARVIEDAADYAHDCRRCY